jgi:HD-GYP domain-containing protein (c-di-GMP phosphodiesterase class II)
MQVLYDTIMTISREHHENYNGTGYPKGLKGNEISMLGRIARVADVISALMGHRCYNREFNSFEAIANYLIKNKGVLFDPAIVDVVINSKESNKNLVTKENLLNVFDIQNEINKIISRKILNRGR